MKVQKSHKLISTVTVGVFAAALAGYTLQAAWAAPVTIGTTSNFAVLASSTVTNTGTTVISGDAGGDIGVSPGSAYVDNGSLTTNGVQHLNDAVAITAQTDLVAAYNDAAGRTPVTQIPTELAGQTLVAGSYSTASGELGINGVLTLDGANDPNSIFIFNAGSTLITGSTSSVELINDAQICNVYWVVGSSATLGTYSSIVGRIMATASITATTGAAIEGQLLARNGAVTLDSNTITNSLCTAVPSETATPTDSATPTATDDAIPLPDTASQWPNLIAVGFGLAFVSALGFIYRRRIRS